MASGPSPPSITTTTITAGVYRWGVTVGCMGDLRQGCLPSPEGTLKFRVTLVLQM